MALPDHVETLRAKHAALEREIDQEMHRPLPNEARLTELKRRKLRLKDELIALGQGRPVIANDRG